MTSTPVITLDMPVDRAVRLVALTLLGAAAASARKLQAHATDPDALHEFRIAVRRLRGWLTLWRPVLRGDLRRKDERRLRRMAHTTGRARDLDVHLHWIAAARRSTRADAQAALKKIRADFKEQRETAGTAAVAAAAKLLARHRRMERQIALHCVDVRNTRESETTFGHALGRTTRAAARELRERLAAVASSEDANAIHKARISAKRLRFLMEPVQHLVPRSGDVIKALKSLQDEAGAIHDAQVLSDALAEAANGADELPSLAHQIGVKERKSAVALDARWLGTSAKPFFARLQRLTAGLETTTTRRS